MFAKFRGINQSGQKFQFTVRSSRVTGGYLAMIQREDEGIYRHTMYAKIHDSEQSARDYLNRNWRAMGLQIIPKPHTHA